jgi:hypothetical protein
MGFHAGWKAAAVQLDELAQKVAAEVGSAP